MTGHILFISARTVVAQRTEMSKTSNPMRMEYPIILERAECVDLFVAEAPLGLSLMSEHLCQRVIGRFWPPQEIDHRSIGRTWKTIMTHPDQHSPAGGEAILH